MTANDLEDLIHQLLRFGIPVEDLDTGALLEFADLLLDRAVPLGMVGRRDADMIVPRHVVGSLQAVPALASLHARRVVDLGSGAGLPGIPCAIALPGVRFTLAEARTKRAAFLELCVERLGLMNVVVHPGRAEMLGGEFDAVTARGFAPPETTWRVAWPLLRPAGALVLFTGAGTRITELPGAVVEVWARPPEPERDRSSANEALATSGDLVIIRAT